MSRAAHVPGQPEVAYELPAQSPQNVMSEMYIQLRTEVRRNIRRTENDGVIREEFEGVASARRQLRSWLSPGGWIRGLTVCDIQRDSGSIEVP